MEFGAQGRLGGKIFLTSSKNNGLSGMDRPYLLNLVISKSTNCVLNCLPVTNYLLALTHYILVDSSTQGQDHMSF